MENSTFKEFLMEIDTGDLEFAADAKRHRDEQERDNTIKNKFRDEMSENTPKRFDIIVDDRGQQFVVKQMSMNGFETKNLMNNTEKVFPHGTKFQSAGKTKGGIPAFKVV